MINGGCLNLRFCNTRAVIEFQNLHLIDHAKLPKRTVAWMSACTCISQLGITEACTFTFIIISHFCSIIVNVHRIKVETNLNKQTSKYIGFHNEYENLTCKICFPCEMILHNPKKHARPAYCVWIARLMDYRLLLQQDQQWVLREFLTRDTPPLEAQEVAFPAQQRNELQMKYILIL